MFIKNLVQTIIKKHQHRLGDLCIVVPNNRAKVYIKQELQMQLMHASMLPQMVSVDEFMQEAAACVKQLRIANQISQLFTFYKIYTETLTQEELKEEKSAFRFFVPWATTALRDFNDIDLYMINANKAFTYLNETKAIELWKIGDEGLSTFEKNYIALFNSFELYYHKLREELEKDGLGYSGQVYRFVAEHIAEISNTLPWEHIVFAGLNALTSSEKTVIDYLYKEKKADIIWDIDKYYYQNETQEAGLFLRENLKNWTNTKPKTIEDNFAKKKNINIISAPGNVQQAKIVGNILEKENFNPSETVIVLADENLLLPVLNSIPEKYNKFNVTMGLSVDNSFISDFIISVVNMHRKNANINKESQIVFNAENYYKVLQNPLFNRQISANKKLYNSLQELCALEFIRLSHINNAFNTQDSQGNLKYLYHLFAYSFNQDATKLIKSIITVIEVFQNEIVSLPEFNLDYEIALMLRQSLNQLLKMMSEHIYLNEYDNLLLALSFLIRNLSVSFIGEPLNGLQLMGILETRLLDFKNVIILSLNENILPKSAKFNSYLPYEFTRENHIPGSREKTAIFAYHFYRLIQRSENIYLIYDSSEGLIGANEKSRYISQLEVELPKYNPAIDLSTHYNYVKRQKLVKPKNINQLENYVVRKTDTSKELINKSINNMLEKGFSPSKFISYCECEANFFYKHILKIDDNTILDELDDRVLGTITHNALKKLYEPKLNIILQKHDFIEMKNKMINVVEESFVQEGIDTSIGRNLLIKRIVEHYMTSMIETDMIKAKDNELIIKELEQTHIVELNVNNKKIKIKGVVDRVESIDGKIRVMDYKTGKIEDTEYDFEDVLKFFEEKDLDNYEKKKLNYAIQLLFYALFIFESNDFKHINELECGLYGLRNFEFYYDYINNSEDINEATRAKPLKKNKERMFKKGSITRESIDDFKTIVQAKLENLIEKDEFEYCINGSYCSACNNRFYEISDY